MNLSSHVPASSSSAKSPIASKSPEKITATEKRESRTRRNSKSDAASSSQVWLQDAYLVGSMDTATGRNLSQQKRSQGMWTFPNLKPGVFKKKQWRGNPLHPANQTASEVQKLKEKYGHTIYKYIQTQLTIRKQFSRSSGKPTDENMTTLWMIWMWIWLFGAYFSMPLFEQQFILDRTMRRSYDTWRIIFGAVWNSYSMKLENWSVNKQRSLVYTRSLSKNLRWCRQASCAVKLISTPAPKPTSSPTLYSDRRKWEMILLQPGSVGLIGIRKTITSRIWIESTAGRRSSSGQHSQESQRWASSRRFKV